MDSSPATLTVSRLARRVGVSPDTIRYYDRIGLLTAATRTAADHRRYDTAAIDRLRFILGMQRLGLRLADIPSLLDLRQTGHCPCEPAAGLLRHRLERIDTELAKLTELREELASFVARIPADDCPEPAPGTWRPRRVWGSKTRSRSVNWRFALVSINSRDQLERVQKPCLVC